MSKKSVVLWAMFLIILVLMTPLSDPLLRILSAQEAKTLLAGVIPGCLAFSLIGYPILFFCFESEKRHAFSSFLGTELMLFLLLLLSLLLAPILSARLAAKPIHRIPLHSRQWSGGTDSP